METELQEIKDNIEILQDKIARLQNFKIPRYDIEIVGEYDDREFSIYENEQGEFIRVSELINILGIKE